MTIQGTSLNPLDVASGAGTNVPILSNANLTLTGQANNNFMAIRSVASAASGEFTFSVTVNAKGGFGPAIGFIETGFSLNTFGATGSGFPGAAVWQSNGSFGVDNGSQVYTWQGWKTGDLLTLHVNVTTQEAWGQVNGGPWNNSLTANPASGAGGASWSALSGAVNPVAWINDFGGAASQVTFAFQVPDGPITQPPGCQMWAGVVPSTGLPIVSWVGGGDPSKGTGGIFFAGGPMPGVPLYLTAFGTGDAGVILNTTPPPARAPKGFLPGWPSAGGPGGDGFNPLTAQGSAIGNVGQKAASFPTTPGLVQGMTGYRSGRFYYEFGVTYDIFSEATGVGVGRLGVDLTAWGAAGGFSSVDPNGGAKVDGGTPANSFTIGINANTIDGPTDGGAPSGSIIGVAVIITPDYTPFVYNWQQLIPTPLVCVPCVELILPGQTFRNRFGA